MTVKDHEKSKKMSEKGTGKYLGGGFWSWKTENVVQIFSLPIKAIAGCWGSMRKIACRKCPR